jgi:hypothetical protein
MKYTCPACGAKIPWYGLKQRVKRQNSFLKIDPIGSFCRSCGVELQFVQPKWSRWITYGMVTIVLVMVLIDLFKLSDIKHALWRWPHFLFGILFIIGISIKGKYQSA